MEESERGRNRERSFQHNWRGRKPHSLDSTVTLSRYSIRAGCWGVVTACVCVCARVQGICSMRELRIRINLSRYDADAFHIFRANPCGKKMCDNVFIAEPSGRRITRSAFFTGILQNTISLPLRGSITFSVFFFVQALLWFFNLIAFRLRRRCRPFGDG